MRFRITIIMLFWAFISVTYADTIPIDQTKYELVRVSSDNTNHPGNHAFDDDLSSWWALHNSAGYSLPGEIVIELDTTHNISGFTYLPNAGNSKLKVKDFEVYLTSDTTDWGSYERAGTFYWDGDDDVERRTVQFGPIEAKFVYIKYLTQYSTGKNIHTCDLQILKSTLAGSGKQNQSIFLDQIPLQTNQSEPILLEGHSSSGLEISYEIMEGPATVEGNILSFTGEAGNVILRAYNEGNENYYAAEIMQYFEVVDISIYKPSLHTTLSSNYPIAMPELMPYLLTAKANIDMPEVLEISDVSFKINGEEYEAEKKDGIYKFWWVPNSFGTYSIEITATASNGNDTTQNFDIEVTDQFNDIEVRTFDNDLIHFGTTGQWFYGTYELPQFVGNCDEITAYFSTDCPNISGGCDDWDRVAWVDIKSPEGKWVELIRYITPYGIGCDHQLDVTDYASLLQGEVELRMFIGTFGTGGWNFTLDFDYHAGAPEFNYSKVDIIWDGTFNFGNPNLLQPVEPSQVGFDINTESAKLKLVTTGHGWGENNTNNAAEFYHAIHHIHVNGANTFEQDLWTDCNPNPDGCINQQGTWYYDRAGWCPGAIADIYEYDLTPYVEDTNIELSYVFQETYMDQCHPQNPDCITGVTCPDCNASFNPHYYVSGNLITYGNQPFGVPMVETEIQNVTNNFEFDIFPNPNQGSFRINSQSNFTGAILSIQSSDGLYVAKYDFENNDQLTERFFDLSYLSKGVYFITIETNNSFGVQPFVIK